MKTVTTITFVLALIMIGTLGYVPVGAAEEGKTVEQMIVEAKTPADHEAIAAHYEKAAQEAHQKQAEHQKMKERYEKNPALNKSGFSTHCDLIAANYDKMAKEYEALAKLHRDMAKSAE